MHGRMSACIAACMHACPHDRMSACMQHAHTHAEGMVTASPFYGLPRLQSLIPAQAGARSHSLTGLHDLLRSQQTLVLLPLLLPLPLYRS